MAELLVRAKSLLRRGTSRRENVLRVGNLELDRLTQQVRLSGKTVDLTIKEYALLEYLMANTDRVLSRSMILAHVWDQSFSGANQYRRRLRQASSQQNRRRGSEVDSYHAWRSYAIREE
jgi:DNA-binding response OmpR family regulator